MRFTDRREAGRLLAEQLSRFVDQKPVVLALPRGGVPVGFEVARVLRAPLDVVLVRKIGAPDNEEFAIGAIAESDRGDTVPDSQATRYGVSRGYIEMATTQALEEIKRRRRAYCGDRQPTEVRGRTAIVVDDGIATGATMRAALRAVRQREPARLVLAVPVAAPDSLRRLRRDADEVVCLDSPRRFFAVGQFYEEFPQLSDTEVTELLSAARDLITADQGGQE